MKKILLLPNPLKPAALALAEPVEKLFIKYGLEMVVAGTNPVPDAPEAPSQAELFSGVDLVIVLGGDGSMLNAARRIYPRQIPLLGVNLGHLGFLTRVESNQLEEACCQLREGLYDFDERTMIEAAVIREGQTTRRLIGLNDLVLAKSSFTRMLRIETWIDAEYFTTYPADGLIVASATGSTAYSLSAGGPILDPRLAALVVAPICAHSLYARPLVLSEEAWIRAVFHAELGHGEVSLTADGQETLALQSGDAIEFGKAPHVTKLLRFKGQGFFDVLKTRLQEGRI